MYILQVNIYTTNRCNRNCECCYNPKNEMEMDKALAEKVGIWIADLCQTNTVKKTIIHFLGGEPFLNLAALTTIVDTFNLHKPPFTEPFGRDGNEGFLVFTNGDHLNTRNMRELKQRHILVKLNPTNLSLKEIEKRIIQIKNAFGGAGLAIVLDDLNLERLPELTQLAVRHQIHIRVNRLYIGGAIPGYVDRYLEQMHRMFDILLESDWIMWPNFLIENSYITWPGPKNPNACGKFLLIIEPDGNIRSCNADPNTGMGHIDTHKSLSDFTFPCRWTAKNLPECQGCEWITWCQGGCPYTRKTAFGTYDKKSPFCPALKELFPRAFELKEKWSRKEK